MGYNGNYKGNFRNNSKPNHKKPEYKLDKNLTFVNPYNFVRLPQNPNARTGIAEAGMLTGKISCVIKTKTPLAILDTESVSMDEKKHPSYKFYTIDGKKSIPGSTIRGCLRSLYETLTDSCFVTMPDNEYLSKRVGSRDAFKPALLIKENNGWKLYAAARSCIKTKKSTEFNEAIKTIDNIKERCIVQSADDTQYFLGDCVQFSPKKETTQSGCALVNRMKKVSQSDSYVYVGEPIFNKNYQSVFTKEEQIKTSEMTLKKAMSRLEFVVNMYQNSSINRNYKKDSNDDIKNHWGYAGYERTKKNGVIPVWYKKAGDELYLSMAAVGRMAYANTVNDLVGEDRVPCKSRDNACPACNLFGMVKGDGRGSKVRVTDAVEITNASVRSVTLKELGSPRDSYLAFYSVDGKSYDEDGAQINGRKYYWHISKAAKNVDIYTTKEKTERNATVEVVDDAEFAFDVYFDKISEKQLKALKWILTMGDNKDESSQCHKIGHGKPLGLGSVKICIKNIICREYSAEDGYKVTNTDKVENSDDIVEFEASLKDQVEAIADLHRMDGEDVRYPYISAGNCDLRDFKKNDYASHQWFASNNGRTKNDPPPKRLKNVTEPNQQLYAYKIINKQR